MARTARGGATLAVLALLVAGGAANSDMEELARLLRESCVEETGVDEAVFAAVNERGEPLPPEPTLKCYLKCVMEMAGMYDDGAVDVDAVVAVLDDDMRDKLESHVRACGSQPGEDDCDVVYNTQLCWQKRSRDYILV